MHLQGDGAQHNKISEVQGRTRFEFVTLVMTHSVASEVYVMASKERGIAGGGQTQLTTEAPALNCQLCGNACEDTTCSDFSRSRSAASHVITQGTSCCTSTQHSARESTALPSAHRGACGDSQSDESKGTCTHSIHCPVPCGVIAFPTETDQPKRKYALGRAYSTSVVA